MHYNCNCRTRAVAQCRDDTADRNRCQTSSCFGHMSSFLFYARLKLVSTDQSTGVCLCGPRQDRKGVSILLGALYYCDYPDSACFGFSCRPVFPQSDPDGPPDDLGRRAHSQTAQNCNRGRAQMCTNVQRVSPHLVSLYSISRANARHHTIAICQWWMLLSLIALSVGDAQWGRHTYTHRETSKAKLLRRRRGAKRPHVLVCKPLRFGLINKSFKIHKHNGLNLHSV